MEVDTPLGNVDTGDVEADSEVGCSAKLLFVWDTKLSLFKGLSHEMDLDFDDING